MGYLLVIPLRQFFAPFLTLPPSRNLAFSNSLRLGICFTPYKASIIRDGDLSGRVVHPWFTWFMAVMGVHLHQESRHQWAQLTIQGTIAQRLLRMVLGMQETGSAFDIFQAFYLMAMSCTYTHTLVPARRYLEKCQVMIKMERYRLVDPDWIDASTRTSSSAIIDDRPSEYTDEKHELVSILVGLMYQQCIHCMLYNECHGLYADLEAQLPEFEVRCVIMSSGHVVEVLLHSGLIGISSMALRLCSGPALFFWSGMCSFMSICSGNRVRTPATKSIGVVGAYPWPRSLAKGVAE